MDDEEKLLNELLDEDTYIPLSENFPIIEDDFDAVTDYELFSKAIDYLNDNKADKSDIPDVSNFITKDVDDLTNYTLTSDLANVALSGNYNDLSNKPTIPDVSNFITKDVDDLTNYTLTSDLANVALSGNYNDLSNKPTIPTTTNDLTNNSGFITNSVNNLTNYTTTTSLTSLLSNKENVIDYGSNSNGYYMKFDNGTMIEWNTLHVSNQAISNAYGSLYQGTRVITFPVAFVGDLPNCQCTEFQWGASASWGTVGGKTLTTMTCRGIDIQSRATGVNTNISWIAIGKWK